jgi:hypothetical protein
VKSDYELIDDLIFLADNSEVNAETLDVLKDYTNEKERKILKDFLQKTLDTLNMIC